MGRKWRYLYLIAYKNDPREVWWSKGGKFLKDSWPRMGAVNELPSVLDALGRKGWELVAVVPYGDESGTWQKMYFKADYDGEDDETGTWQKQDDNYQANRGEEWNYERQ